MDMLPSSPLPADLLLEVLARCDPATVIRCAATCKPWYRCITDPSFPRLLRAHTGGGRSVTAATTSPVAKTIRAFLSRNAGHLKSFEPWTRRVVGHATGTSPVDMQVCNPVTGWRRSIPAPAVYDQAHVLLPGEDSHSFQLVAMDGGGAWDPEIELSPPEDFERVVTPSPVVLGRVAHWLFRACGAYNVLALDADAARAACIDVPPRSALDSDAIPRKQMLLSSTADGRLSLLAGEETRISAWALSTATTTTGGSSDSGWSLHATYEREWIARFVAPQGPRRKPGYPVIDLERGGGGGAFIGAQGFGSYVLLNMGTNEIVRTEVAKSSCFCPYEYEVDLALLTAPMKSF
ncbi:hypothetical protein SETIT_9G188800v2 [Setaria italica]|uniref:F-box domain-containing protein n=1 Tax=Setaria italica TaxID=4555 RepID=A0A368SIC1_SETIT|nr:hypothetical protein SETIT_9G188800v2 [Setaria italica]